MTNEIRDLAFKRAPTTELRKAAKASGMKSLMQDGVLVRGTALFVPIRGLHYSSGVGPTSIYSRC